MDKDILISYINRLGFNHTSDDDSSFSFDENLCIVLEKKLDYYTSYYGNHPTTYDVKFIWFNEILVQYPLKDIHETDIIDSIDRLMEVYRTKQPGSGGYERWIKYEQLKTPVLKSMKRDLQIQVILMEKDKKRWN